jgi:succinoglycan biosynthesis transport protein ExoP
MPNTTHPSLLIYLNTLRRHWALATFSSLAALAVIVPLVMGLPHVYRASASILVEGPSFEALGSDPAELDRRLQAIKQEALSRARLTDLIQQFHLYSGPRRTFSLADALGRMQKDIQVEVTSTTQRSGQASTVAFRLSYIGTDPATVAQVTNALASFYVAQNDKLRSRVATYKTEFLKASLADAKTKLDNQEQRLTAFTNRNVDALPQQFNANQAALTRISLELQGKTNEQIRQRERRQSLMNQIFDLKNDLSPELADPALELAKRRTELAALRLNQTDDSPDVKAKEREIAALSTQIGSKGPAETAASTGPWRLTALQTELADTDLQLQKLAKDVDTLRDAMNTYQSRLESSPSRNTAFEGIMSDYRAARDLYDSLQKRYDEAQLAERAEQGQGSEQFRILDPALPLSDPAGPNRMQLLLGGFALAILFGIVLVVTVDRFDTSFHTIYELRAFTPVPILASIPLIVTPPDRRRRVMQVCALGGLATAVLLLIGIGAFHYGQASEGITRALLRIGQQ